MVVAQKAKHLGRADTGQVKVHQDNAGDIKSCKGGASTPGGGAQQAEIRMTQYKMLHQRQTGGIASDIEDAAPWRGLFL